MWSFAWRIMLIEGEQKIFKNHLNWENWKKNSRKNQTVKKNRLNRLEYLKNQTKPKTEKNIPNQK